MQTPRLWSWVLSPFAGKVRVAAAEMDVQLELLESDCLSELFFQIYALARSSNHLA